MKKLTLKLDELRIESFDTAKVAGAEGTVMANMDPYTIRSCPQVGCYDSFELCQTVQTCPYCG